MIQEMMAGMLGVEVGCYSHIADSLHLYESDFDLGNKIINEDYPLLYNNNTIDARISFNNLQGDLNAVFLIEKETRLNKNIPLIDVIEKLNIITNQYWKSIASVIAVYNFRKYRRKQNELDALKEYITNEFNLLMKERYNELN